VAATLALGGALLYFSYRDPHPRIESGAGSSPLPEGQGKTGALATAQYVGSNVTYTLIVTNRGPSPSVGATGET